MESVKVKSLGKALTLLDCFIDNPALSVTEIAKRMGLNKSNASDILSTFRDMGYLAQDEPGGKYRLSLKMLRFAQAVYAGIDVRRSVYPHMQALSNELGEVLYYGVISGEQVVYLEGAFPSQLPSNIPMRSMMGIVAPLYCTGIGKAMLSRVPEAEWPHHLPSVLTPYTEDTITDQNALYAELRQTRARGYSQDNMEHEYGIKCVGVALVNRYGHLVAGLSVSGPSLRFDPQRVASIGEKLLEKASLLSEYL